MGFWWARHASAFSLTSFELAGGMFGFYCSIFNLVALKIRRNWIYCHMILLVVDLSQRGNKELYTFSLFTSVNTIDISSIRQIIPGQCIEPNIASWTNEWDENVMCAFPSHCMRMLRSNLYFIACWYLYRIEFGRIHDTITINKFILRQMPIK